MYYSNAVITGLPVSNYEHTVNKLAFDLCGKLYVTIGSNTNAEITSSEFKNFADSLFSSSLATAPTQQLLFNGYFKYVQKLRKRSWMSV